MFLRIEVWSFGELADRGFGLCGIVFYTFDFRLSLQRRVLGSYPGFVSGL